MHGIFEIAESRSQISEINFSDFAPCSPRLSLYAASDPSGWACLIFLRMPRTHSCLRQSRQRAR